MSFADELRNAPQEYQEKEKRKSDQAFEAFIQIFYEEIKKDCKYLAERGSDSYHTSVSDFVKNLQDSRWEAIYSGKASDIWQQVNPRISRLPENSDYLTKREIDLVEDDAKAIQEKITSFLKEDGLTVDSELKSRKLHRKESVYVERSESVKRANAITSLLLLTTDTSDGYYKTQYVFDRYSYDVEFSIKW